MLAGLGSVSADTFASAGAVADVMLGSTAFKASPTMLGTGGVGVADVPALLWCGAGDDDAAGVPFGGWGGLGSDAPAGAALSDAAGGAAGSDAAVAAGLDAGATGADGTDGTAGSAGTAARAALAWPGTRSAIDRAVSASAPASVRRFGSPSPSRIRLLRYVPTPTDVPNPHQHDPC